MTEAMNTEARIPATDLHGTHVARVATVAFALNQVHSQIAALVSNTANVTVICSPEAAPPRCAAINGVDFKPIDIPRSIRPINDCLALIRLWRIFRSARFDIVHSITPKAGLLVAIASYLAGVPIRIHTFTGQVWATRKGLARYVLKLCDKIIVRLSTRVYADSESQIGFLEQERIAEPGIIRLVGAGSLAGVDTNRFAPDRITESERQATRQALSLPAGAQVLIFIGRLHIEKGLRELYAAYRDLASQRPALHLIMVGPDDDANTTFDTASLTTELRSRVHFVGGVKNPEHYLAVAHVLCLPSYREGFGTVVLEAASMGVPTVASDIYGLRDAVVNEKTGLLVKVGDVSALVSAISRLLDDRSGLRSQMADEARKRVVREFDDRVITRLVLDEYVSLLAARCPKWLGTA